MPSSHRERQTERRQRKTEDAHSRGKTHVAVARAEAPRAHRGRPSRARGSLATGGLAAHVPTLGHTRRPTH